MEIIFKSLLYLHIIAGFASLVLFWVPIFTRKGGINHRKVGKAYVYFMWVVVLTAAILSIKNLVIGEMTKGAFLGFISLITANPLWYGMAILRQKKGASGQYKYIHITFNVAISIAGLALILYGILLKGEGAAVLMFIFGALGLANIPTIVKAIKPPVEKIEWFRDHLISMCTSGIAAYTAFLVFGASQFLSSILSGMWMVIPWIAPTIIGTIGIRLAVKFYQKSGMISEKKTV